MASPYPQETTNILHQDQNLDTVDGFKRHLKKTFKKLSCTGARFSSKRTEKSSDESSSKELLDSKDDEKKQKLSPNEFDWDNNKYDFSHRKRGLAIIINNENFRQCSKLYDRLGSTKDATALFNSLKLLGFDVLQYKDLKAWEMVEVLEAASKYYDHGASDCFVCAVLTHGIDAMANIEEKSSAEKVVHLDLLYGIDGIGVTVHYLVETFNDVYCPALTDKPRIFFLQACRGQKCDDGQTLYVQKTEPLNPLQQYGGDEQDLKNKDLAVNLQEESFSSNVERLQNLNLDQRDVVEDADAENDDISNKSEDSEGNSEQPADKRDGLWNPSKDPLPRPAPLYDDFLIMYATPPGHTAWRNEEDGSWFIQTLCSVLNGDDLTSTSLLRALTKVIGLIAREFESQNAEFPKKKGLPVLESKLTKDIFISKKTKGNSC